MTNEEQKLREMVNGISAFTTREELMERLTALISENYYPKEFVGWMLRCSAYSDVPFREFTLKWNVNIGPDEWRYFTTDELFNYWANNEK